MAILKHKEKILQENRYKYNLNHMIYFNSKAKKIFSREAIDDHDENWLTRHIQEKNTDQWQFYCNTPPSESVKNQLINELRHKG